MPNENNTIDADRAIEAIANDELVGFCTECGEEHDRIEPDARNYKCQVCGSMAVNGAEELLISGMLN